ncbi:hypothetical protein GGX14DRAFT_558982 [Mycena pura]|uniref:Uncharacterized protein n=1 Tax=Mycena pura TaxID=153505 RepID=A0AAD6YKN5_9AGAR|nr:hypothetical protein GGX14DRAFT_558982 [Mycena pura]
MSASLPTSSCLFPLAVLPFTMMSATTTLPPRPVRRCSRPHDNIDSEKSQKTYLPNGESFVAPHMGFCATISSSGQVFGHRRGHERVDPLADSSDDDDDDDSMATIKVINNARRAERAQAALRAAAATCTFVFNSFDPLYLLHNRTAFLSLAPPLNDHRLFALVLLPALTLTLIPWPNASLKCLIIEPTLYRFHAYLCISWNLHTVFHRIASTR